MQLTRLLNDHRLDAKLTLHAVSNDKHHYPDEVMRVGAYVWPRYYGFRPTDTVRFFDKLDSCLNELTVENYLPQIAMSQLVVDRSIALPKLTSLSFARLLSVKQIKPLPVKAKALHKWAKFEHE